jgi:general secretion pathway protein B
VSLILDALRRADSERERGSVPGLYSQPAPPLSVEVPLRSRARPWHWTVSGIAVGLLLALAWYIIGRDAPRQATDPAAAGPSPVPVAAAGPATPIVPSASLTQPPPVAEPRPVAEPAPWPTNESRAAPARTLAEPKAAARSDAKAEPPGTPAPAESPIYAREQLPDSIRTQLPPLTFGGSMYSTNAANRSLVINGQLYRENDQLSANLTLEQIKLKSAVLKYKGYRFEIQF